MITPPYTFADLLNIFLSFQRQAEYKVTQDDLASKMNVSRRTIAGWCAGSAAPRNPQIVLKLAKSVGLTALQTDLLLYSVNPSWVKYGTPEAILKTIELLRYNEENVAYVQAVSQTPPSIQQIEQEWSVVFSDTFESNFRRWGLGSKDNGIAQIVRVIGDKSYQLTLHNRYHEDVFMGGDSSCLSPPIYYLRVNARMVQGSSEADGYAIFFEEIGDECHAMFRVRERMRRASVVQTFDGLQNYKVYLRQVPVSLVRPHEFNQLAILAIHDQHWFYLNDVLIGQANIARLSHARLDIGVVAGSEQTVICHFQDFRLYVPRATKVYPELETLLETPAF